MVDNASKTPDAESSNRMYRLHEALERDGSITSDAVFQSRVLDSPDTLFIVCHHGQCLVLDHGDGSYADFFLTRQKLPEALSPLGAGSQEHVCIYLGKGASSSSSSSSSSAMYVAVETSRPDQWLALHESAVFMSLRVASESLQDARAVALLAQAVGFCTWHWRTRHCAKCGAALQSERLGHARRCTDAFCAVTSWPRIEPAAIMMVSSACGGYALLGRKGSWPAQRYSCLAGFAEIGETMEQCVLRETLEESGVRVMRESVRYRLSQPWPFPSSLMMCYSGVAAAAEHSALPAVVVQEEEMEDVRWFSLQEVQQALLPSADTAGAGDLQLPGRASSARFLIEQWVAEQQCN
jgi:NADH pyrophosphatase NudC (nudix superfamily)